jgi:putative ABC transport system permease protein
MLHTFRIAGRALARHPLRTTLTALGIAIGIAAVIATAAIGAGSTADIEAQLDALGESFVWIRGGSARVSGARSGWGTRRSLTVEDARAIETRVPQTPACSPVLSGRSQVVAGGRNWNTRYVGVAPSYFPIRHWTLAGGVPFSDSDVAGRAKVAVLGADVAMEIFPDQNPIGRTLRVGIFPFRVIGVLASRGADRSGINQDDVIVVPYTTAQKSLRGITWVDEIVCATSSAEATPIAEVLVAELLRERHGIEPDEEDDFELRQPRDSLTLRLETRQTMSMMISAIGLVSLVVGGVGIMNIMLVSVTERTREIGLRLSIGARAADIRLQFLVEAVVLCLVGGIGGVVIGLVVSQILTSAFGWQMIVTSEAISVAVGAAAAAGLVFGYLPAQRASSLDPIDALRSE